MKHGKPTVCVPIPETGRASAPYDDHVGRQRRWTARRRRSRIADIDGGRMDGFIAEAEAQARHAAPTSRLPACTHSNGANRRHGLPRRREIPNYWSYAKNFVLQDHMFESDRRLEPARPPVLVSGWSADVRRWPTRPRELHERTAERNRRRAGDADGRRRHPIYAWTDITYLLHRHSVSWALLHRSRAQSPTATPPTKRPARPPSRAPKTPGIWNPLPSSTTPSRTISSATSSRSNNFYTAARSRDSSRPVSLGRAKQRGDEHPPAPVSFGQTYVTTLINAIMKQPRLGLDGDLPRLGRLGRLLRQRRPRRRRGRLRAPRARRW